MNLSATKWRQYGLGIIVGISCWIIDSFLDAFIFREGSLAFQLITPGYEETFMRLSFAAVGILFIRSQFLLADRKGAEEKLKEISQSLQALIHASPLAITVLDNDGIVRMWNPAAERIFGWSADEVLGRFLPTVPEDKKEEFRIFRERVQKGESFTGVEVRRLKKNSSQIDISLSTAAFKDYKGEVIGIVGIMADITERKKMEEDVFRIKQDWEDTFNTLTDMITIHDKDFNIIHANKAAEKILDLPLLEKTSDAKCFRYYHGAERPPEGCPSCNCLQSGQPATFELFEPNLNMFIEIRAIPRFDSQHNLIGLIHVVRDISERRKTEEELQKALKNLEGEQARTEAIISAIGDGISIQDKDYRIIYQNEVQKRNVGDRVGEYCYAAYEGMDQTCGGCPIRMSFEDGGIHTVERTVFTDLGVLHLEITTSVLKDAAGEITAGIEVVRNVTERKKSQERIERQIQKLSALRSIDLAISSSLDIRVTLKVFIDHAVTQLGVDAANVLLLNPRTYTLDYAASQGFRTNALQHSRLRLGYGYAGAAALENRIVSVPDLRTEEGGFKQFGLLDGEDFVSYFGVPLVAKGHVKGVLEIFHRSLLEPDAEWFEFLDALALQASIAIDNNSLFYDLERSNLGLVQAYDSTIEGWSRALDYRDRETEGHSQRVTELTLKIAAEMGLPEDELVHVRRGALLHDIGKMGIPDSILLKPGKLTEEEWTIMRLHPKYAYELIFPIAYLRPALDIPYFHHEKWDGSGYPTGLKGQQIPIAARIFAVVDVWDALRSDRPYRAAWSEQETIDYILSLSDSEFDPDVVKIFIKLISEEE